MKKNLLTSLILGTVISFTGISNLSAQADFKCGTTEAHQKLYAAHPELATAENTNNALLAAQMKAIKSNKTIDTSTQIYIIPIVFHVIHINGTENISDAQIIDEVNILNRDWRKQNADSSTIIPAFQGIAADMKIEFRLAQLDPSGNCTNGIDRIYSHKTDNANDRSKLNAWPRDKYLNVWVIRTMESVGTAGYAYYPSATDTYMQPYDGIIIIHSYIGSIGTGSAYTSRALTHEVGHWLNLPHTWGSTNSPEVACGDEGVMDTPITKGHDNCSNRYDYECDSKLLTGTYTFGSVTTSSGMTDPSTPPEATDSAITFSSPVAVGVSTNSTVPAQFSFSGWDNGALNGETVYSALTGARNAAKYYEITITPDAAQALTLTGMTFNIQRDTNGPRTFVVRSVADFYASNLPATIFPSNPNLSVQSGNVFFINTDITTSLTETKVTLSGANFTNINNGGRTFRIYAYNAEDSTGSFGIDNLTFSGSHGIMENVENYMEYSYCSKMYTYDQKTRTRSALRATLSNRNNLWINSNLAATGTDGSASPCTPDPQFYANRYMVCPGGTVTFTKNILNITPGLTTTSTWTFPGGSPATSSAANPIVTYSTPGSYDVTLTATNSAGTGTVTRTYMISVSDSYSQVSNTYSENCENPTEFYSMWRTVDLDNNSRTFWYNSSVGYSGTHSVVMNPYYNYPGDVDQLISPSYNLTYITSPVLTFRCAAATKATTASDMNDKLVVYSSIDCGATWNLRKTFSGVSFLNNSYHPEEFVPTSTTQWALQSVPISASAITANTRFKFEYTSGNAGNSIYIDDINMTGVLGIDESTMDAANLSIFPNPTNQTATLSYTLIRKGNVKIELVDVLGKKIMEMNKTNQAEGDYTFQISKQELNLLNGIYFVKFSIDNTSMTKKLVISE
ncbi:hypothetical protein BH10BAC1_BH10BAC1_10100 [soil metagenome]